MKRVTVTFVVGIALILGIVALVLTGSPTRVLRGGVPRSALLTLASSDTTLCQANEVLPGGTTAVRLSMWAFFGSTVHVTAFSGSRVLTEGNRNAAWTGTSVTVPVKPVKRTSSNVKLCLSLAPNSEPLLLLGAGTQPQDAALVVKNGLPASVLPRSGGQSLSGKLGIEYIAAAPGSWWSRIVAVARHIGLGHVFNGTWVALLIVMLMGAVGVLTVRLALREIP